MKKQLGLKRHDLSEEDILTVAEQLLSLKRYKQRILVELINMGILVKTNRNTYDIKHHFFRDYFAAVYTENQHAE